MEETIKILLVIQITQLGLWLARHNILRMGGHVP